MTRIGAYIALVHFTSSVTQHAKARRQGFNRTAYAERGKAVKHHRAVLYGLSPGCDAEGGFSAVARFLGIQSPFHVWGAQAFARPGLFTMVTVILSQLRIHNHWKKFRFVIQWDEPRNLSSCPPSIGVSELTQKEATQLAQARK